MLKVFICIGTRADIIKMSPIINKLKKDGKFNTYVCLSGQHHELALSAVDTLNIPVDSYNNIMKAYQSYDYLVEKIVCLYTEKMKAFSPDIVLVHGDTSTSFCGALSAAYLKIPVMHIEAGLRTYSKTPFPEELHRRLITNCSTFFACPDLKSQENLLNEGVPCNNISVTGNTIADVLFSSLDLKYEFRNDILKRIPYESKFEIIITLHRSETTEDDIVYVCNVLKRIIRSSQNTVVFWPVHPNPRIKTTVFKHLDNTNNVYLLDPLIVQDMHNLIFKSSLVLTDSAGIQEESFLLEKPTIVLRNTTERPRYMDTNKSVLLSPKSNELYDKIKKIIDASDVKTDYGIFDKLKTKTGATKSIEKLLENYSQSGRIL